MYESNDILIQKLEQFIRRYYKNQLLKGVLYSTFFILCGFLVINALEYFGYFNTTVRAVLFWVGLIGILALIGIYILYPLSKLLRIGKVISYDEAAKIIGNHFLEVQDKLLNVLQLKGELSKNESDLLKASIQQKTELLSPIPFFRAIDFKKNKKYLKYTIVPVIALLLILILYPSFIIEPSKRIVDYNTYYEKPAPFSFEIQNKNLETPQQETFRLEMKIVGDVLPNEVYIVSGGISSKMKKESKVLYSYEFRNVNQDITFHFEAGKVVSGNHTLKVLPKPTLINFSIQVQSPGYTKRLVETYRNVGDITVAQGSSVKWTFETKDARFLSFWFNEDSQQDSIGKNQQLSITKRLVKDIEYGFYVGNEYVSSTDSLKFLISVIEDMYPVISAMEYKDSLIADRIFFRGEIKDDYGFSKLQFKLSKKNSKGKTSEVVVETNLPLKSGETMQEFNYSFDLAALQPQPGDEIEYYFEVWDNDAYSGAKSATSQKFFFRMMSLNEVEQMTEKTSSEIKQETDKSISEIKKIQQEIQDIMRKLVDKKELNWQDKKQLQDLAEKQKQIKESLQDIQEKIKQNNQLEEHYKKLEESIIEKQRELEKLFEQIMSDEIKQMMEEIDKLLNEEMDKDKIKSALDKLKMDNESIEKQLDRNIELLKKFEIEKGLKEAIQKTSDLAEEQKKLAEETKEASKEDLKAVEEKQEKLNEKFEDIKKQLDDLEKKNAELDDPQDMKRNKEREKSVGDKQKEAKDNLEKQNKKGAEQKQKEAAQEMEQMAEELEQMQQEMEEDEMAEDADRIRQLLKNLVALSFEQESLIERLKGTYIQDPKYQEIINRQNKLKDDFKMVEDTLSAIAKRQIKISTIVTKETTVIGANISQTMDNLLRYNQSHYGRSQNYSANTYMQYTMTSFNNLALILAESLDQMQDQMRSNKQKGGGSSSKSCSNPSSSSGGKQKSKSQSMREMQEEMQKRLEEMKNALEKQKKDGEQKGQGQPRRVGEGSEINQELARMAAQQERIRKMMQEYGEEMKSQSGGKQNGNFDALLREMEQLEKDIVNKTITQQTMRRQQQIVTRLLEHEKADQKREQEERRESTEGKDIYRKMMLDSLFNKKKQQGSEQEMFKWETPSFSPFYKKKVGDYFYNLNE